ncbi:hypothetical protein HY970_03865 [Candidatus Kaiserbacteria bacterium]|nr:hypothetical protein [Candidatus Kaiserbacteria bacterium]
MKFTPILSSVREAYARRHEPEHVRSLAALFWRSMLAFTAISLIGIVLYGSWEFMRVMQIVSAPEDFRIAPRAALDRNRLERVLSDITARRDAYDAVGSTFVPIADPSR